MTRRYDVRTGMVDENPDAGQPREELVPGWHVPGRTRYDYDLRIGDAERDVAMTQLREHFVAGRLDYDELSERIDAALIAKTQRQIDGLVADLPRPPRVHRGEPRLPAPAPDAGRVPSRRSWAWCGCASSSAASSFSAESAVAAGRWRSCCSSRPWRWSGG